MDERLKQYLPPEALAALERAEQVTPVYGMYALNRCIEDVPQLCQMLAEARARVAELQQTLAECGQWESEVYKAIEPFVNAAQQDSDEYSVPSSIVMKLIAVHLSTNTMARQHLDAAIANARAAGAAAERERLEPLVTAAKALLDLVVERHCITSADEFTCPRMRALWEATKEALLVGDRKPTKAEIEYGRTLEVAAIRATEED